MNVPALRPSCQRCGTFLEYRTPQTQEQKWCGTWYDHPPIHGGTFGHTATLLLPSVELGRQLGEVN